MTHCTHCGRPLPGKLRRPCRQRCADLALGKRLWRALRRLCQIDRTPTRREAA